MKTLWQLVQHLVGGWERSDEDPARNTENKFECDVVGRSARRQDLVDAWEVDPRSVSVVAAVPEKEACDEARA